MIDPEKDSDAEENEFDESKVEMQNSMDQKKLELSSGHFSEPSETASEVELTKAKEYADVENRQA